MASPDQPQQPDSRSNTRVATPGDDAPKAASGLLERALGPYRIRRRLGGGGMGTVYEASDERLQRLVAVKVLTERLANDPEAQARFLAEARAAARLSHPNVVTVFEAGETGGLSYLVMELVPGGSVQERV